MNQKIWQPFLFSLLIIFGILIGMWLKPSTGGGMFYSGKNKISQLLGIIGKAYVDTVNIDSLEEVAINDVLHQLDPHSVYIPARDLAAANEGLEGNFEGVGIEFSIVDDTILVAKTIKDGPAEEAGLKQGDKMIQVDTTPVAGIGITNEKVFKLLRGASGSKVQVKVFRPYQAKIVEVTITREKVPIYSVDVALMLNNQTGYIKIDRFAANTHQEFKDALKTLRASSFKHLVIDLRNNPGGYLSAATAIADELLDDKKLLVYTEGRTQQREDYKAENSGEFEVGKLIVLIDEGSASASEIVSGAIQDWDRGVIIGRRSFGKGLVQEPFELGDGSAVRLTISRYYTPSGRSIQKDYTHGLDAYEQEITNRFELGELKGATGQKVNDSTVYKTANGRIVYGGGGIMPDVFVPVDTGYLNPFYHAIFEKNTLSGLGFKYLESSREELKQKYKHAGVFTASYSISDVLWKELVTTISISHKNEFTAKDVQQASQQVKLLYKAFIARQLWGDEGYYTVMNSEDKAIKKALETLSSNYNSLLR